MMTTTGWIFMALFWGFIIIVTIWCFKIVLFEKRSFGDPGPASGGGTPGEAGTTPASGKDPGPSTGLPVPPTP